MKRLQCLKLVIIIAFLPMIFGCAGELLSVDKITDASRNDVVILGDSIFALSGEEGEALFGLAGETFRFYAVSGAEQNGGFLAPDISHQFEEARADDPNINTVISDGGGNDILIPAVALDPYNCKKNWWESKLSDTCKELINDVCVDLTNDINHMGYYGVQNIIFQGYYHLKLGLIGNPNLNDAVDYGDLKMSQAVANATLVPNRIFADPRGYLNTSSDIVFDGVHPSTSGSQKLANLIWSKLQPIL